MGFLAYQIRYKKQQLDAKDEVVLFLVVSKSPRHALLILLRSHELGVSVGTLSFHSMTFVED